jgi:hypothetical protein
MLKERLSGVRGLGSLILDRLEMGGWGFEGGDD